jgi:hypothetical protein
MGKPAHKPPDSAKGSAAMLRAVAGGDRASIGSQITIQIHALANILNRNPATW